MHFLSATGRDCVERSSLTLSKIRKSPPFPSSHHTVFSRCWALVTAAYSHSSNHHSACQINTWIMLLICIQFAFRSLEEYFNMMSLLIAAGHIVFSSCIVIFKAPIMQKCLNSSKRESFTESQKPNWNTRDVQRGWKSIRFQWTIVIFCNGKKTNLTSKPHLITHYKRADVTSVLHEYKKKTEYMDDSCIAF